MTTNSALQPFVTSLHPIALPAAPSAIATCTGICYTQITGRAVACSQGTIAGPEEERRRAPPEEFVDYIVEIESWDWSYWLAVNMERRSMHSREALRRIRQVSLQILQAGSPCGPPSMVEV